MISPGKHNDFELFLLVANGDQSAYTLIYQKYTRILYSYVLKILKSEVWAEEVVQDIFLDIWLNRERLKDVENPPAFLYRITANRTIDWIRRRNIDLKIVYYSRRRVSVRVNTTEQMLDYRFSEVLIKEAINHLPRQRKLVYKLKYEEDMSYDEIAHELNLSKHTVRNQLVKSVEFIRTYFQQKTDISLISMLLTFSFC